MDCPQCEQPIAFDPESDWGFCFACGQWRQSPKEPPCPGPQRWQYGPLPYRPREHKRVT